MKQIVSPLSTRPISHLFDYEGIPLVEFRACAKGLESAHENIQNYYSLIFSSAETYCREILLPRCITKYASSDNPRKRFIVRRVQVAVSIDAREEGEYLSVERRIRIQHAENRREGVCGEVFRLSDGRRVPIQHFIGNAELSPRHLKKRHGDKLWRTVLAEARRGSYILHDKNPLIFTKALKIPLK